MVKFTGAKCSTWTLTCMLKSMAEKTQDQIGGDHCGKKKIWKDHRKGIFITLARHLSPKWP